MSEVLILGVYGLGIMSALGFLTWLLSLYRKDVSIVDSLWSLMFLAAIIYYALNTDNLSNGHILLLALVAIWAIRLSLFLTIRNWGEQEDRRYQVIRANNQPYFNLKSLYIVFGLQALLAWIISTPLLLAFSVELSIGVIEIAAVCIWLTGFVFETVADIQLYRFKSNPANNGKVLDSGLWKYSRHPNYFGESLIWWAYFLFVLSPGFWWAAFSPIIMTLLLLKVSGVSLMEKDISQRRADYSRYIKATNAFLPGKPKQRNEVSVHE